ncbi:MAG: putative serine/threonine protein kinase [Gemmatimonadetes bacterium]|nr:putative serine/threonine protein kinase [Gemmatimonadota bacterium]
MTDFADHLQEALGANYQLDRELTGGGMSRVFVATDRLLGRKVVVKVLPPELAAGVNRDRFRREIQVAAQLQHPHIVPLLSAGEQGDLLWYIMPYIEGESLRAALERKKHFSAREVMRILHDIVDALAFAHERGVVHRDIKPANILTQGAHALVTDFGVAKALSAAMPMTGLTSAGIAIGTPAYMAPEQLAGDAAADHRIDIYAVGLLAYELVTGVSPFTGPSPRETLAAQLTRDPKPLHELSGEIPRSLSTLIMRCLSKDPAGRPQRAEDILLELDSMTMPLGVTPRGGGISAPRQQRRWTGVAAVAILFVVLAGVGYAVVRQRPAASLGTVPIVTPVVVRPPAVPSPAAMDTMVKLAIAASGVAQEKAKPLITHDDSVRIAAAVQKKMEASRLRDSVAKAKLAEQTQRKMMDSVIAANSGTAGAAASAPRRLMIAEPAEVRGWPEAGLVGRAVSDSLRRMLRTRRQFAVVDLDSVRGALSRTRDMSELSKALNADLLVTIRFSALPHDSGMITLQAYDLTAANAYRQRGATSKPVARNEVLANLDALLLSTVTYLDEMVRGPRRPPPPPPPI